MAKKHFQEKPCRFTFFRKVFFWATYKRWPPNKSQPLYNMHCVFSLLLKQTFFTGLIDMPWTGHWLWGLSVTSLMTDPFFSMTPDWEICSEGCLESQFKHDLFHILKSIKRVYLPQSVSFTILLARYQKRVKGGAELAPLWIPASFTSED